MDIATRHNRSFLGLNIQLIKDGCLKLRTLAVRELTTAHTGSNLKDEVLDILNEYRITIDRIYTCTTDNGSNVIKMTKMLQAEEFNFDETDVLDEIEIEEIETEDVEEIDDADVLLNNEEDETLDDSLQEESTEDSIIKTEEVIRHEEFDNDAADVSTLLTLVRCGVHTLQLAVNGLIKEPNFSFFATINKVNY